jgi:outer membrane biosynthesis protein TonB
VKSTNLLPWVALAVFAHGAAFGAAANRPPPPVEWMGPPLEVELAPPNEPEPPPSPPEPEHEESPTPAPAPPPQIKAAPRPTAPTLAAAAKVGALLTSGETADSADPVAFFSDPNGSAYGSGVVARGGQAEHGTGPVIAAVAAPPAVRPSADAVIPAADLSRTPSLDEPDACRGFFPTDAAVDSAKVDLVVIVNASGRVKSLQIARESPAGEGFGAAARACLSVKQFTSALDRAGRAVTASASVRLHFTR